MFKQHAIVLKMEKNIQKLTSSNKDSLDLQSPLEELTHLALQIEEPSSPEPEHEAEIEIAARGGTYSGQKSGRSEYGSGSSDQGRGPSLRDSPAGFAEVSSPDFAKSHLPQHSDLQASSFRLQLGGILPPARPGSGSGLISRKDSGCSTPLSVSSSLRAEHLQYQCANFVQCKTPGTNLADIEDSSKMTIVCHYNPIMDEYVSLTDELENVDKAMTAEENDIDCLFDLCKEDFPFLSSEQQTINIGKFLHDLEKAGIRRTDKRLGRFMAALQKIVVEEGTKGQSVDNLNLNKEVYKRAIQADFKLIAKAFKNQLIIPEFPDFCQVIKEI